jgi:hypothetical protein
MNVLFSPATVPLNPAPLVWPSKLKNRKYLPPYIPTPSGALTASNIQGLDFRQSTGMPASAEISGLNNQQVIVPQAAVNNLINRETQGNNPQNQISAPTQPKKPYVSPSLRPKPVEKSDGIDVRMDKTPDEDLVEPPLMNQVQGVSMVESDETDSEPTQTMSEDSKQNLSLEMEKTNEDKTEVMTPPKRQFVVNILNKKPKPDAQLKLESEKEGEKEDKENVREEEIQILNQMKGDSSSQEASQESQEAKVMSSKEKEEEK